MLATTKKEQKRAWLASYIGRFANVVMLLSLIEILFQLVSRYYFAYAMKHFFVEKVLTIWFFLIF